MELSEFLALPRVTSASCSPDGTWLAVSVQRLDADGAKFISDIWRAPTDGSPPTLLLKNDHNERAPRFREDGALGFLSDRPVPDEEEPERSQVWLWSDGALSQLSDEPLGVTSFAFSGPRLVLLSPHRPGVPLSEQRALAADEKKHGPSARHYRSLRSRHWDHWLPAAQPHLVVIDEDGRRDLTPDPGERLRETSLSAAGGRAVVVAQEPGADQVPCGWLLVFDLETGACQELGRAPHTSMSSPVLSSDGARLLCSRHVRAQGRYGDESLWLFALPSGEGRALAEDWDCLPTPAGFTTGAAVAIRHERGTERLYRIDLTDGTRQALSDTGSITAVSCDVGVCGLWSDLLTPPQPFLLADDGLCHLPLHAPPSFDVEVEEQSGVLRDGAKIHMRVVRPTSAGPHPVLLLVHGGPISDWSDRWHWRWSAAVLASRGYLVALPNPRGSLGYGMSFVDGIWGNRWGGQCYRDLMACVDALAARSDADGDRVAAMGGSFGGYMMNWFGVSTGRFRCLISHAGISNLSSFQGVTDHPAWWLHQQGVSAVSDPVELGRYSPMRLVRRWTSPVLFIHGEQDYRCPIDQALQLYTALQLEGVSSELLVFPDEGHWIQRPRNIVAWYSAVLSYLGERLSG